MRRMMMCNKKILLGLVLLAFVGCGGTGSYYMLSGPTVIQPHATKELPVIGVEKLSLPEYMQQGKVAIQLSPTQISYAESDKWAENMEDSLTKQMISTIQKSFNHPNVYTYPWDLSQQAAIKIKISISRFIAYGNFVYLDATWKITDLQRGKSYSRLFGIKVPSNKETAEIVSSMNVAFAKLSLAVVADINRRF